MPKTTAALLRRLYQDITLCSEAEKNPPNLGSISSRVFLNQGRNLRNQISSQSKIPFHFDFEYYQASVLG